MQQKNIYNEIYNKIEESNNIAILVHDTVDGDCVGSVLAMYSIIKEKYQNNKNVDMYIDLIPEKFKFFPKILESKQEYENKEYDLCICLDCGDDKRFNKFKDVYNNSKFKIQIDHHITNTMYADINLLDLDASSTCEVIYDVLEGNNIEVNKEIAEYIYMGIATDTGSFQFSNTSSKTLNIVSNLTRKGVRFTKISEEIYNKSSKQRFKFLSHVINNTEFLLNDKIAYVYITKEEMEKYDILDNEVEGMIQYLRSIENIELAILIREREDKNIKVSMRSKEIVDVSKLSKEFGGGGHVRAAGFASEYNENIKEEIVEKAKKYFI